MELGHLLMVFGLGMLTAGIIVLVCVAIDERSKLSAHEQRLMQIKVEQEIGEWELSQLTQSYLQRVKSQAPHHRTHADGKSNRTQ